MSGHIIKDVESRFNSVEPLSYVIKFSAMIGQNTIYVLNVFTDCIQATFEGAEVCVVAR